MNSFLAVIARLLLILQYVALIVVLLLLAWSSADVRSLLAHLPFGLRWFPILALVVFWRIAAFYVTSMPPREFVALPELGILNAVFFSSCIVLATTLLFPTDYPNSWVDFAWKIRLSTPGSLFISLIIFAVPPLTALSIATINEAAQNPKPIAMFWALFISCVVRLLIGSAISTFLFAQATFVAYGWFQYESGFVWLLVFWCIKIFVLLAILGVAFLILIRSLVPLLRALLTSYCIMKPYFDRSKSRFISSYKSSREYENVSSDLAPVTRLLLVSDLHVSASDRQVLESDRPSEETLAKLSALVQSRRPDALIILGDITDTGHEQAWERVKECISTLNTPVFAIPGNHDYHFKSHNELSLFPESISTSVVGRHIASLWPDILLPKPGDAPTLTPNYRTKAIPTEKPKTISFPTLERIGTTNVLLVLLDSNRRENSNPFTNAIGFIGRDQMKEAESLIKNSRRETDFLILLLHHHVLLPKGKVRDRYLQCLDAEDLLAFAERNNVNLIAHGHIHLPLIIEYPRSDGASAMPILSCGSLHHPSGDCGTEASAYVVTVCGSRGFTASLVV